MRVAVLGDVHGNAAALDAALRAAREAGAERLLITGDLVGYYYWPAKVLEMLSEWPCDIVRGNHEDMLCDVRRGLGELAPLSKKYGSGLAIALASLTDEQQTYLCDLPRARCVELSGRRILLAHGAPWSTDAYIYPDASPDLFKSIALTARQSGATMVCLGHTHYQMLKQVDDVVVLNPGSIGQPRDGRKGACWALVEVTSLQVELRTERYDVDQVADIAKLKDPEQPYLHDILYR